MKKQYRLTNLDCANCAARLERAIKGTAGVNQAGVNFLTQKLFIDAADERFEAVMSEVVSICKRIEPDCKIQL
jgi:cation transport ATPase